MLELTPYSLQLQLAAASILPIVVAHHVNLENEHSMPAQWSMFQTLQMLPVELCRRRLIGGPPELQEGFALVPPVQPIGAPRNLVACLLPMAHSP